MTKTFNAGAGKVQSEKSPAPLIGQRASQFTFPPKALLMSIVVAGLLALLILSRLPVSPHVAQSQWLKSSENLL
jgi:hypothetical protein